MSMIVKKTIHAKTITTTIMSITTNTQRRHLAVVITIIMESGPVILYVVGLVLYFIALLSPLPESLSNLLMLSAMVVTGYQVILKELVKPLRKYPFKEILAKRAYFNDASCHWSCFSWRL